MFPWAPGRNGLGNADESRFLGRVLLSTHAAQISRSSGTSEVNISITGAALKEE